MRASLIIFTLVSLGAATAASAQQRNAPQLIAAGDYRAAEQQLDADRKIFPQEPELLLNLAAVYQYTGRTEQARALYRQILAQPDVRGRMAQIGIVPVGSGQADFARFVVAQRERAARLIRAANNILD